MSVARLSLVDFRSYASAEIAPGAGFVVLTGDNGAGKTNLLEAVSMLAPGRGLRGAKLSEMAREDGAGGFAIAARMVANGGDVELGTGASPEAPERRQVRINGASATANALGEWLSILWLTPAMDRLFVDTPGSRRKFLDRLVLALDPAHARNVSRYEAAMRDRNRLLADEAPLDVEWCAALEAQMYEYGGPLHMARDEAITALNAAILDTPEGSFPRARLTLDGWEGGDLCAVLAANRQRDRAAGRSLVGPHRSDLIVTHIAKGRPAASSSTGEQKALLLSIVLAHADLVAHRLERRPLLLLDEVAAHLDPARRAALFERLAPDGGQVWMTGTEPALFCDLSGEASCYAIEGGVISRY